jgi:transposase-like protein
MTQVCQVCNHAKRLEIDRQLVQGKSHASISREYGVSSDSIRNHANSHLSRQLVKSHEMKQAIESAGLVTEIEDLLKRSKHILRRAERDGKLSVALGAIRETRGTLELMAKICATIYQIQAQELQAQQNDQEDANDTMLHENMHRLTDTELSMLVALTEKMAGERFDDVIKAVMQEPSYSSATRPKRIRRRVPACMVDEEWSEEREQQAIEEENFLPLEPDLLEPLEQEPLSLNNLNLTESKAGTWGRKKSPFERAVEPGSIRTSNPQLRRLYDMD